MRAPIFAYQTAGHGSARLRTDDGAVAADRNDHGPGRALLQQGHHPLVVGREPIRRRSFCRHQNDLTPIGKATLNHVGVVQLELRGWTDVRVGIDGNVVGATFGHQR
jgi:hypothetical protein